MPVIFRIPDYLATFTEQQTSITLEGSPTNVGQALELLWKQYPALHDRLVDEQSRLRPQVNVFVANDSIHQKDGLATLLPGSVSVSILPSLGVI